MQSGAAKSCQKAATSSREQPGAARSMLLIIYMIATPGITSATRWGVTGCANSITATVAMTKNTSGARQRNAFQPGAARRQRGAASSNQVQPGAATLPGADSSQELHAAARSGQGQPGAAMRSWEQPEAARSNQEHVPNIFLIATIAITRSTPSLVTQQM